MTEAAREAPAVRHRRRHWVALLAITLGLAALTAAAGHLALVRLNYGTWARTPGESIPRIPFHGRVYLRGRPYPVLPAGVERLADGPAGGGIYSPAADLRLRPVRRPVAIHRRAGVELPRGVDGALIGGPRCPAFPCSVRLRS